MASASTGFTSVVLLEKENLGTIVCGRVRNWARTARVTSWAFLSLRNLSLRAHAGADIFDCVRPSVSVRNDLYARRQANR